MPLTPVQRWFLEQPWHAPHHYNQALLLRCLRPVKWEQLAVVISEIINRHDALRLRFRQRDDGEWIQEYGEPVAETHELIDLSTVEDQEPVIAEAATRVQKGLDLARGPLFRTALFQCRPPHPQRLLLVAHHLVVDHVSWASHRRLDDWPASVGTRRASSASSFVNAVRTLGHRVGEVCVAGDCASGAGLLGQRDEKYRLYIEIKNTGVTSRANNH